MIKIRENAHLTQLIAQRNAKRSEFVHKELDTSMQYGPLFAQSKKHASDCFHQWLYAFIAYGILWLLFYESIENIFVMIIAIVLTIGVCALLWRAIYFIRKRNFITLDWNKANAIDEIVLKESIELNHQAAKEALGIICLSEHFFELSVLEADEKARRWQAIVREHKTAINQEYNQRATIEDVLEYYEKWERRITQ